MRCLFRSVVHLPYSSMISAMSAFIFSNVIKSGVFVDSLAISESISLADSGLAAVTNISYLQNARKHNAFLTQMMLIAEY
jgi:hypothetical protein